MRLFVGLDGCYPTKNDFCLLLLLPFIYSTDIHKYINIILVRNGKNFPNLIEEREPIGHLQIDKNSLASTRENNTYYIQRKEGKK